MTNSRETSSNSAARNPRPKNNLNQTTNKSQNNKSQNANHERTETTTGPRKCNCDVNATGPLTVRKEGANQGREFYVCGKDKDCNFFEWADETSENNGSKKNNPGTKKRNSGQMAGNSANQQPAKRSNSTSKPTGPIEPQNCLCDMPGLQLTVRKDGPNQNRPFFTCGNNKACNFFAWADEGTNLGSGQNQGGSQNQGNDSKKRKAPTCSNCGKIGHTKRGCKNN